MPERAAVVCLFSQPTQTREGEGAAAVTGFEGVAYSGGVVPNHGWGGDMAIDLASMALPPTEVTILRNHDSNQIVGRATVENTGSALRIVRGKFSAATEAGREVAALMAEGHPWMLSVGVNARSTDVDPSTPTTLNGRAMAISTILRNSRLLEVSFVPSGADPDAHAYEARLSALAGIVPAQPPKDPPMPDPIAPTAAELATANARIADLTAQLAAVTTERDTTRTELAAVQLATRNAELVALFGEKNSLTEVQLAAYRSMAPEAFAVVRETLGAAAALDPSLTRQTATSGRDHQAGGATSHTFKAPDGLPVDAERAQLDAKARAYMAQNKGTEYFAAVMAVSQ